MNTKADINERGLCHQCGYGVLESTDPRIGDWSCERCGTPVYVGDQLTHAAADHALRGLTAERDAERDAAITRADRLRDALILACNATDGFASPEVSDEFLLAVPGEAAKCIGRLRARAEAAEAERDEARNEAKDEAAEFIFGVLEEALGNPAYNPCDGTETWDGDVAGTVYRLLEASGVRNENTGELATARAEAAEAQVAALTAKVDALLAVAQQVVDNAAATCDRMWVSDEELAEMARQAIARAALASKEPSHD